MHQTRLYRNNSAKRTSPTRSHVFGLYSCQWASPLLRIRATCACAFYAAFSVFFLVYATCTICGYIHASSASSKGENPGCPDTNHGPLYHRSWLRSGFPKIDNGFIGSCWDRTNGSIILYCIPLAEYDELQRKSCFFLQMKCYISKEMMEFSISMLHVRLPESPE